MAKDYRLEGIRALLVEDNAINQQIAVELMEDAGMIVDVAENGRVAVDKLKIGEQYDIVLMDLQMPEMDGYTATAAIRSELGLTALPVVALTAHAMAGERQRCLDAGMNDHIAKPIDPDVLLAALARWSGRQARGHAEPKTKAPALPSIEGIDTEAAMRRVGGNAALYYKLLAQFIAGQADAAVRVKAHLAAGDRMSAQRIAHSVKGVAGNIGAVALAEIAGRLEQAIAGGQENAMLQQRFADMSVATIAVLSKALPDEVLQQPAPGTTVPAAAQETLQQLADYLSGGDSEAIDYVAQHRNELIAALGQSAGQVERAINDFDFDTALTRLYAATQEADIHLRRVQ